MENPKNPRKKNPPPSLPSILTTRGVKDKYGEALVNEGHVWRFWRTSVGSTGPLTEQALRNAFRRVAGPRVLFDMDFEWGTTQERFEETFGKEAARHWQLKYSSALELNALSNILKSHYVEDVKRQLWGKQMLIPLKHGIDEDASPYWKSEIKKVRWYTRWWRALQAKD